MPAPDINFRNIRKHRNSQNDGFEELTRQLVLADPPPDTLVIENRGPGADGGVEILVTLANGRAWGWQSKYFLDGIGNSEITQLKESFSAALENFPALDRYIVALPRNLSGNGQGAEATQTKKWNTFKDWCSAKAQAAGRAIEVDLWDDTYFVSRLQRNDPVYSGMAHYWFNHTILTQQWFEHQFLKSLQHIGKRYRPDDHVEVRASYPVRVLRRHRSLGQRLTQITELLSAAITALNAIVSSNEAKSPLKESSAALSKSLGEKLESLRHLDHGNLYADELSDILFSVKSIRQDRDEYSVILSGLYKNSRKADENPDAHSTEFIYSSSVRHQIELFASNLGAAEDTFSSSEVDLLKYPALLMVGDAGSGKSHLLASEAKSHLREGGPAIFLPARILDRGEKPEREILEYLDLNDLRFEVFLSALQCAALASGMPALIILDGINESQFAAGWESGLPAILVQIEAFPNLALCVSIRSAYRKLCIRPGLNLVSVTHQGFKGHLGQAAKEYLDNNKIERPSAPIFGLNEILYNPLFLSTAVDFIKGKGGTSFPRGLESFSTLVEFWLQSIEESLIAKRYERISLGDDKLPAVMRGIAAAMAKAGSESIDYEDANRICERVIDLAPPAKPGDRLLQRLIDEGIILDFPDYKSRTGKLVSFAFQKFSDYFFADAIICSSKDEEELLASLSPSGSFNYLFSEEDYYKFVGPRTALIALIAIRFKKEFIDMCNGRGSELKFAVEEFVSSISWRHSKDIYPTTVKILEAQRNQGDVVDDEMWFDLLLSQSPFPDCLLNASYLKGYLACLPQGRRDASWSAYLVGKAEEYEDDWSAVNQLIDWSWVGPDVPLEFDMVHQVGLVLSLFTTTFDRDVRDRSTKALSSILIKYPHEIPRLLDEFADWDDSYVRERVLAAAVAGVLYCNDTPLIERTAIAADRMVFLKTPVERHAWTRRFAQIIIDHAIATGINLDEDLRSRSRPPYRSDPIVVWPTVEELVSKRENAGAIFDSVIGFVSTPYDGKGPKLAGDFGRYTMGGIELSFSRMKRDEGVPLRRDEEVANFWKQAVSLNSEIASIRENLENLTNTCFDWAAVISGLSKRNGAEVAGHDDDVLEKEANAKEQVEELTRRLASAIPPQLRHDYERIKPLDRGRRGGIPPFPLATGQCWVFQRSVELGWDKSIHEEIERRLSRYFHSRTDHQVERIGKKDQHIAFSELVGYLADYHWYIGVGEGTSILTRLEEFERSDIDPTFLSGKFSRRICRNPPFRLALPKMTFVPKDPDSNVEWAKTLDDVPDPLRYLIQTDTDGREWYLQHCFYRSEDYKNSFNGSDRFRGAQYSVELILVRRAERGKLASVTTEALLRGDHDVFDNGPSDPELFGQKSYRHMCGNYPVQLLNKVADFSFGRTAVTYSPNFGAFDRSGADIENSFLTPNGPVISALKLRPENAWSGRFVMEDGSLAFCDFPEAFEGFGIVRGDLIEEVAAAQDLQVAWRVWIEKDGGGVDGADGKRKLFARHDFIGFFFKESEEWQGSFVPFRQ